MQTVLGNVVVVALSSKYHVLKCCCLFVPPGDIVVENVHHEKERERGRERETEREREQEARRLTSGNVPLEKTMSKQVLPQAPSPTITSFLRISAIVRVG
jgi:hypothetical protein